MATLGDAINNATIRTSGGTPFSTPVAIVFTPDQSTDARIRTALRRSGYPSGMVNTFVFPASMLTLGDGAAADAPAKLDAAELEEPTAAELEALSRRGGHEV